jgi:trigger factor
LETKVNELTASEHEVEVTLQYEEIQSEITEAYKEERKKISIPGFRKGKAPIAMLKKMYGDAIEYQASEKIANGKFWDVVESEGLKPISTPQLTDIDFQPGEKLYFKVKYEVKPVLEVKDYTGLEIEKPVFKVKDDDIQKEIDTLLKSKATFSEVDSVENEQVKLTVDLQKLDENGSIVEGTKSENMVIDLSDSKVNPEIRDQAIGKKLGDKFNFSFTDEHKHGEETHKEVYNYECEIKKAEKVLMPEITEDLIQEISQKKSKTLDELKSQLMENYTNYYDQQADRVYTNSLLNKIVENNEFDPPKGYVQTLLKRFIEMEKENAKRYKTPFNESEAETQFAVKAEWNAKWEIIMDNIAAKEGIVVEEDDLKKMAEAEAKQTGISVEKLMKFYKDSKKDEGLLEEKVLEFLKEKNTVVEFDPEERQKQKSEGKK